MISATNERTHSLKLLKGAPVFLLGRYYLCLIKKMSFESGSNVCETLRQNGVLSVVEAWYTKSLEIQKKSPEEVLRALKKYYKDELEILEQLEDSETEVLSILRLIGFQEKTPKEVFYKINKPKETEWEALQTQGITDVIDAWYDKPELRIKTVEAVFGALIKLYQKNNEIAVVSSLQKNKSQVLRYIRSVGFLAEAQQQKEELKAVQKAEIQELHRAQKEAERILSPLARDTHQQAWRELSVFTTLCEERAKGLQAALPESQQAAFEMFFGALVKKLHEQWTKLHLAEDKKQEAQAQKELSPLLAHSQDPALLVFEGDSKKIEQHLSLGKKAKAILGKVKNPETRARLLESFEIQQKAFLAEAVAHYRQILQETEKDQEAISDKTEKLIISLFAGIDPRDQVWLEVCPDGFDRGAVRDFLALEKKKKGLLADIEDPEIRKDLEAFFGQKEKQLFEKIEAFVDSQQTEKTEETQEAFGEATSSGEEKKAVSVPPKEKTSTGGTDPLSPSPKPRNPEPEAQEVVLSPSEAEGLVKKYGIDAKILQSALPEGLFNRGLLFFDQLVQQNRSFRELMEERGGATYLAPAFIVSLGKHKSPTAVLESVRKIPTMDDEEVYLTLVSRVLVSDAQAGLGHVFHENTAIETGVRTGLVTKLKWRSDSADKFVKSARKPQKPLHAEDIDQAEIMALERQHQGLERTTNPGTEFQAWIRRKIEAVTHLEGSAIV